MSNNIKNEYPIILTAKDVSEILKISKPTAYELMAQNDFPLIKIGRCKRVLKDDFLEWLANEAQNKSR
ncbi:helix-turn-helix domain-containing protein [Robertmurraya sp. 2P01SA]|uniref:helix-turn-helix domain-containing protein n=1 Tax=Robertmurraya sp. 2P01SA TaxID=3132300 RepID=UPI0039A50F96